MGAVTLAAPPSEFELHMLERAFFQQPGKRFSTTQRLFFEALLADPDFDYRRTAKRLEVPLATARTWMQKPHVEEAIDHLLKQRMTRLGISSDQALVQIAHLLEMAVGTRPVKRAVYDRDSKTFVTHEVYETDLAAAGRFTDQLSKHLGLYKDEDNSGLSVTVQMNLGGSVAANLGNEKEVGLIGKAPPNAPSEGGPDSAPLLLDATPEVPPAPDTPDDAISDLLS